MSYTFTPSDKPTKNLSHVSFGIMSPETIKEMSVAKIMYEQPYENKEPRCGGLADPRMGCIERNMECYTCGETIDNCPGHFGHIELESPVYHIGLIKVIKKLLECICPRCARFRLLPDDPKYKKLKHVRDKFSYAWSVAKVKTVCEYEDCEAQLVAIRRAGTNLYYDHRKIDKKGQKVNISPAEAREILERISDETCWLIGLNPESARPEWMIITVLAVPPPCVRPSVSVDGNGRGEDDLTHKLTDIIKASNNIKKHENTRLINEMREQLQFHVTTYFDNEVSGIDKALQRNGRPIKSITTRLKGKEGRIRGNLMGKRVDFSARTVITGDPNLSIEELGVPKSIAKNLTFPERVSNHNIEHLQRIVYNSPDYPGAKFVIKGENGARISLKQLKERKVPLPILKCGDIVERHLLTGDWVLFNRQPTLHKMSMMAHKVRVMDYSTFRMNVNVCASYNADFDGDEMNMHVPQSYAAIAELQTLSTVSKNLISPQKSGPVNALVQDALYGIRKFTKRDVFLTKAEMMNMCLWIKDFDGRLPQPAIIKPAPLWTGKQVISMIMPKIDLTGYHSQHSAVEEELKKSNASKRELDDFYNLNSHDTKVTIMDGELISGIICKKTVGASAGGVVHIIWNDYGPDETRDFMDNAAQVINYWLLHYGFSVGVGDAILNAEHVKTIRDSLAEHNQKAHAVIEMYQAGKLLPAGSLSLEETKENKIQNILSAARDGAGRIANKYLDPENNIKQMVMAGSKGSILNISQIAADVGQQVVEGKRITYGFRDRTLPHYTKYDDSPASRGFVFNSFIAGLTPQEVFFHAMGGREGLIDTAVKSVTRDTAIFIIENGIPKRVLIGDWIDYNMEKESSRVSHTPKDRNLEYLETREKDSIYIPTTTEDGVVTWEKVTALSRHDPGKRLYKVRTLGGRIVTVTESQSLLVYKNGKFVPILSPEVKVGDFLPVTSNLPEAPLGIKEDENGYESGLLFGKLLAKQSADKVPDAAIIASREFIIGLLKGVFTGHWMVSEKGIEVESHSEQLLEGIAMLCSRIGIFAEFGERRLIVPKRWAARFAQIVGIQVPLSCINEDNYSQQNDVVLDKIVSLEEIGVEDNPKMYDLTVPSTLNFGLANGLMCRDTSESGYIQRRLVKALEDLVIKYDGTVRNSRGEVIQFYYGEDGMDGTAMEQQVFTTMLLSDADFKEKYLVPELEETEFSQLAKDRQFLRKTLRLMENKWSLPLNLKRLITRVQTVYNINRNTVSDLEYSEVFSRVSALRKKLKPSNLNILSNKNPSELFHILLQSTFASKVVVEDYKLTKAAFDFILGEIEKKYNRGLVHPGESVGVIAAQSIGEPATQMTLNSVEYNTELLLLVNGKLQRVKIGEYITEVFLKAEKTNIESHPNDTWLAWLRDGDIKIQSCDENGKIHWKAVEAVTKHPVVNKDGSKDLLLVKLFSGIEVVATKAKSFLKRVVNKIVAVEGDELKVGDYLPVLQKPKDRKDNQLIPKLELSNITHVDIELGNVRDLLLDPCISTEDKEIIEMCLEEEIFYDEIISITTVVSEHPYVYDLTVADTRTFCAANGLCLYDTFHLSGTGNKTVTTGIPRLKEVINAVKNLKTPGMTIYMKPEYAHDLKEVKRLRAKMEHTTLDDILSRGGVEIYYDPDYTDTTVVADKDWMKIRTEIPDEDDPLPEMLHPWVMRLLLCREKLISRNLSIDDVARVIERTFPNEIVLFHSDNNNEVLSMQIRVYKDEDFFNENEPDQTPGHVFFELILSDLMGGLTINGIPGIAKAFINKKQISKYGSDGKPQSGEKEYIIETEGINMRDVLKIVEIDDTRLTCNDPQEMLNLFGVDVARESVLEEIRNVIESGGSQISFRHLSLLCDVMTNRGQIMSITRHGINKTDAGPLMKCTFEQTVDILLDAAVNGEVDEIHGVAENIMLGRVAPIGTGMMQMILDENMLNKMPEHILEQQENMIEKEMIHERNAKRKREEEFGPRQMRGPVRDTLIEKVDDDMQQVQQVQQEQQEPLPGGFNPLRPSYLQK